MIHYIQTCSVIAVCVLPDLKRKGMFKIVSRDRYNLVKSSSDMGFAYKDDTA